MDLSGGHARVFCIPAVKVAAHAAHGGGYDVAFLEFVSGGVFDDPGGFDAEDSRERDAGGVALSGKHLGAVEAEGFDAD